MQKVFQLIFSLTVLYIAFISIKQFYPVFFDNDWSKFLGGIGGFVYPFIVGFFSLLFGSSKEASKEVGLKISKINIFSKNAGNASGDGNNRNNTYDLPK